MYLFSSTSLSSLYKIVNFSIFFFVSSSQKFNFAVSVTGWVCGNVDQDMYSPTNFSAKLLLNPNRGKCNHKFWAISVVFHQLPKVNNHRLVENSPNLVIMFVLLTQVLSIQSPGNLTCAALMLNWWLMSGHFQAAIRLHFCWTRKNKNQWQDAVQFTALGICLQIAIEGYKSNFTLLI
jgi:hypothetical protein